MAIDTLPGEIIVKTRDQVKADYLRSYKIRNPSADVGPETQPDIDAATFSDQMVPVYANAQTTGRNILLKDATGTKLDEIGNAEGVPRNPASKASGFVICIAAATGGTIFEGDELVEEPTKIRYECALTASYSDGDLVPVRSIDTGLAVNQEPGTVLSWGSPRPGIGPVATVYEQADGSGLTGGAEAEQDDVYRARIEERRADPPAAGNAAEYVQLIEKTPGLGIEKAFAYPAAPTGPGSISLAFTTRPQTAGGSRVPTGIQIADVEAWVVGQMPEDDSAFFLTLADQDMDLALEIEWSEATTGWADIARWPPRLVAQKIVIESVTDATHFVLKTANADYTGVTAPAVGQTIGFFDAPHKKFQRKRILTVTGAGPWTIVCDTASNASDTTYVPQLLQPCCPWADALNVVIAPILAYFGTFGPGELYATFFDAGYRHKRWPRPPRLWPIEVSNRVLDDVFELAEVQDAVVAEGLGQTTNVGVPGTMAYLGRLRFLTAFPMP